MRAEAPPSPSRSLCIAQAISATGDNLHHLEQCVLALAEGEHMDALLCGGDGARLVEVCWELELWDCVFCLLRHGASPFFPGGHSVLFRACQRAHTLATIEDVDFLRELAAIPEVAMTALEPSCGLQETPLEYVMSSLFDDPHPVLDAVLETVLDARALAAKREREGNELPLDGARDGDGLEENQDGVQHQKAIIVVMEMLLDVTGPDSIDKISSIDEYGVTRQRLVELMLLHLLPPVFVDSAGRTPLVIAIALELWTTAHEIIRRSRDLSLADRTRLLDSDANGQSPLLMLVTLMRRWDAESGADVALGHCPEDVLLALLAAGAKVAPDDRGLEALWTVVLLRNSAVAQMLLDRLPSLINAPLPESLARDIFAGTSRLPLAVPQRELLAPALYDVVVDAEDEVVVARVVKQMLQKGARPIDLLDCAIASKDSPTLRALAVECARRDGEESDPTSTARFAKVLRGLMDSAISDSNCEELLVAILGVPAEHNVSFYADTASSAADISPLAAAVQRSNLRACRARRWLR